MISRKKSRKSVKLQKNSYKLPQLLRHQKFMKILEKKVIEVLLDFWTTQLHSIITRSEEELIKKSRREWSFRLLKRAKREIELVLD